MFDETFGEVDYEEDYCYTAHKDLQWGDEEQSVEVMIMYDEDAEEITQFQRDTFEALMQDWDEMQYKNLDDNGVAVLIEDGEVTDVGYKSMAY